MRLLKFAIALLLTGGLTWLLSNPLQFGEKRFPALGHLFNPFTGFWQNADPVPQGEEDLFRLPGLTAPAEVVYDERLVPHIFAENLRDALAVQGFIVAQHRLWQMDIMARRAAGRLSEVLGPATLEIDRRQRRMGLPYAAEQTLATWQESTLGMELLEAYSDGVNAYLRQLSPKDYPLEYKLMGYGPEAWSPLKTALVMKVMAATLCAREDDLEATNSLEQLGREAFDYLFPEYNPKQTPVIPAGTVWNFGPAADSTDQSGAEGLSGFYRSRPLPKPSEFLGSNNWALAGSKTADGAPILCNDPHLELTLPAIWYEVQLHTPEFNAYGVCLPGVPALMIGFNEQVAWGLTNVGQDVLDWYRLEWADEARTAYYFDGKEEPVQFRAETIQVKGARTVYDTVRYTRFGPIVYEDPERPQHNLAMRWLAHDRPDDFDLNAAFKLLQAGSVEEAIDGSMFHWTPAMNMALADRSGDIALRIMGHLPIKEQEQGRFVQEGAGLGSLWEGLIPQKEMPQVVNPASGFVASANQRTTDASYPYYYNGHFDDYRGRLLNRLLSRTQNVGVRDMMSLQTSNYSIQAEEALPRMLELLAGEELNTIQEGLVRILSDWDFRFDPEQTAPILFEEWWNALYRNLWDEFYGQSGSPLILYPETWRTVEMLSEQPHSVYWDDLSTPEREDPAAIVRRSFRQMAKELRPYLDKVDYHWGQHHAFQIRHLSRLPAFASRTLRPGGYSQALNAVRLVGSEKVTGPSWRMIVEMGPEIKAYGVFPGGQSGNPGSPFYDNMLDEWEEGKYFELQFMASPSDTRQRVLRRERFIK